MPYYPPAAAGGGGSLTVKEVDGTPSVASVTEIKVTNGSLTDNTGGSVSVVTGGGGGSSGALIFLEAHTASASATLDFTTFISATYDTYKIEIVDIAPASNAVDFQIEIGTGGGPTYDTASNYEWGRSGITTGGGAGSGSAATGVGILFSSLSNNAGYGFGTASLTATNLQSTAHRKTLHGTLQYVSSTPASVIASWGMQWTTTGTAVTALRFLMSSGNIASGTIRIYGVATS